MTELVKKCLTCKADGHTYLECPTVPFGALVSAAFGLEPMLGPTREQLAAAISCNAHEAVYEDGAGYICGHCGENLRDD